MKNCVAIITARGGSKRIQKKNIKNFLGFPILKYSIEAALGAGCFNEVMVSTEDKEIVDVALTYGAKIPFLRTVDTANDFATTADVITEVLTQYKVRGREFSYCCCIYPTAPFITSEKLKTAYEELIKSGAKSVVPVVRFGFPIQRSFKIVEGHVEMNWPEYMNSRSQDLTPSFHDCGQFYFLRTDEFLRSGKLFTDFTVPYEMPESEVQDIDNEEDWKVAELKYKLVMLNDRHS